VTAYYKFPPHSNSEISSKIGQYLTKLKRTVQSVTVFLGEGEALGTLGKRLIVLVGLANSHIYARIHNG